MRVDRTVLALVVATAMIAAAGSLRPPETKGGMSTDLFWARKVSLGREYDLVICGDSRVLVGVSPAAMRGILGGLKIVNYAFNSQGYSSSYLESAARLLDPEGSRILLFGITPYSLTPKALKSNMFEAQDRLHPAEIFQRLRFAVLLDFFRPYNLPAIRMALFPAGHTLHQTYHEDGWVASRMEPPDLRLQLESFRRNFAGNRVSAEVIAGLAEFVRAERADGVLVFAFRPPTTPEMERLERKLGGFEQTAVIEAVEGAGGIWLRLTGGGCVSYDGSHITGESAVKLSKDLAESIAVCLPVRR